MTSPPVPPQAPAVADVADVAGPAPERAFLARSAEVVAPELLGVILVVGGAAMRIVEVEAYEQHDAASHSSIGERPRTTVMFGPAGHLYVYRSYGLHWCANVVCGSVGFGSAVLLRAGEPVAGTAAMWARRPRATNERQLGSGPGKLCGALAITGAHNGCDLLADDAPVRLALPRSGVPGGAGREWAPAASDVVQTTRIGITKDVDRPWRWFERANPHVSRPAARATRLTGTAGDVWPSASSASGSASRRSAS